METNPYICGVCFPIFLFHFFHVHAYIGDTVDLVSDQSRKSTQKASHVNFLLSRYKQTLCLCYTEMIKSAIELHLKNVHTLILKKIVKKIFS